MLSQRIRIVFDRTVDTVLGFIFVLIILGIVIGTFHLLISVGKLIVTQKIAGHYIDMITDVLTLYVLIELSRSLSEYFHSQKLRLTFISDAAIVFIIRELLIAMYKHEATPDLLYSYSAVLFVLGLIRIGSVLVYQREKRINREMERYQDTDSTEQRE